MSDSRDQEAECWLPRRHAERRHRQPVQPPYLTEDGLVLADLREGPRRQGERGSEPPLPAEEDD
ncbi:hypothetical protein [Jeongeupia sp. USM3]|uniref:hypothetical protein n=1 Tax=Jeongeupia sp. USM3 TaxID=1906741 RepID=UPI0011AB8BF1|nr:hypothetical protein [Jeongeupia sp. USM3]